MEHAGIRIDTNELARLSDLMETGIARLTLEIHTLAGREFNIASPQQLGKILFEEMGLPAPVRYGKGKTISTAVDVLESLALEYEIVRKVLEYRQLTKLKGTYVDALPALMDAATGRIHTSFNQTGAATGRPVVFESELGRTFRSKPNWGARSGRHSFHVKDGSWWSRTTRRSNCDCSPTCRATRY